MSFPRYPEYQDSGVEWLGRVPETWGVTKVRHLLAKIEQGWSPQCDGEPVSSTDKWGVLKVGCVNGGIFRPDENKALPAELDPLPELGVCRGDVLVSRANTRELVGSAAVVERDHPNLLLCDKLYRLRAKQPKAGRFIQRFLQSSGAREQIELAASGASASMVNISQSVILGMTCALPPEAEQASIAAFLDRETAKIDALVAEQQRLVELLKEKRQAVISNAVTKGLNPDAPMKPSGVEWLGEVPEHWEPTRLRNLFRQVKRQGHEEKPVLSVYRDFGVILKESRSDNINKTPENLSAYQLVLPEDLVVNKMKAWQGSLGVSSLEGITSPDYVVFSPLRKEHSAFLHLLLRSAAMVSVYRGISNGIRPDQWRLEPSQFLGLSPYMPPLCEQKRIATQVGELSMLFDALIAEAQRAITLLQERRTALISAAVTGQIDVRGLTSSEVA